VHPPARTTCATSPHTAPPAMASGAERRQPGAHLPQRVRGQAAASRGRRRRTAERQQTDWMGLEAGWRSTGEDRRSHQKLAVGCQQ
jgi:hypothetical protein